MSDVRRKFSVAASNPNVVAAATSVLPRGNAIDALAAGVLAACADSRVVLMGPLQILVAGPGIGVRAVDGRARQPGKGTRRPRGFRPEDLIPAAARVASPCLPAALAAAVAAFGTLTLSRVAGPALELAKARSKARAKVLARVARVGPLALAEAEIQSELTAAAGLLTGGLLTADDLSGTTTELVACRDGATAEGNLTRIPWAPEEALGGEHTRVLAVADSRGALAVACWEEAEEGLPIEALDLVAPYAAHPVLRGEVRTAPGFALPAPSPIALAGAGKTLMAALGVEGTSHAEALLLERLQPLLRGTPPTDAPMPTGRLICALRLV
jgi:gamma-glutamyltranspeptidase/glutathione hydrolase